MIIIVQDYGAEVGKQSNCLIIESSKGKKEISVNQIEELQLYPACSISSDAVQLCMQNDVWIVFLNRFGDAEGEIVPFSGGSSPIYKRNQLMLVHSSQGVEIVKELLSEKIENRIRQLKKISRNKRSEEALLVLNTSIKKMETELSKIQYTRASDMDDVRASLQGYEGNAGRAYFDVISYLLPDDMVFLKRGRGATDIYNSVLNYTYGILYSKIKKISYKCRLDPYIGIMHVDSYNKPTFVYDFIEGQRIICEELALDICCNRKITNEDITEVTEKGARFSEEARKLIVTEFYKKLQEKCFYKRKQVTVENRIYLEMRDLATRIGRMDVDVLAAV